MPRLRSSAVLLTLFAAVAVVSTEAASGSRGKTRAQPSLTTEARFWNHVRGQAGKAVTSKQLAGDLGVSHRAAQTALGRMVKRNLATFQTDRTFKLAAQLGQQPLAEQIEAPEPARGAPLRGAPLAVVATWEGLRDLATTQDPVSLQELAQKLKLSHRQTNRIMRVLLARGLVTRQGANRFLIAADLATQMPAELVDPPLTAPAVTAADAPKSDLRVEADAGGVRVAGVPHGGRVTVFTRERSHAITSTDGSLTREAVSAARSRDTIGEEQTVDGWELDTSLTFEGAQTNGVVNVVAYDTVGRKTMRTAEVTDSNRPNLDVGFNDQNLWYTEPFRPEGAAADSPTVVKFLGVETILGPAEFQFENLRTQKTTTVNVTKHGFVGVVEASPSDRIIVSVRPGPHTTWREISKLTVPVPRGATFRYRPLEERDDAPLPKTRRRIPKDLDKTQRVGPTETRDLLALPEGSHDWVVNKTAIAQLDPDRENAVVESKLALILQNYAFDSGMRLQFRSAKGGLALNGMATKEPNSLQLEFLRAIAADDVLGPLFESKTHDFYAFTAQRSDSGGVTVTWNQAE